MGEFDAVTERAAGFALTSAPSLVPALGVQRLDGALWLVSELDDGVWLDRLLGVSRPRPAQAIVISLDMIHGLQSVHTAGYAHGSVTAAQFRVGVDGKVRLDGWLAGALASSGPLDEQRRADLAAVAVLLADLADQARGYLPVTNGNTPAVVAALDAAVEQATMPDARADLVAAALEDACGADQEAAARTELAALVTALTTRDRPPAGRGPAEPAEPREPAEPVTGPTGPPVGGRRDEHRSDPRFDLSAAPHTRLRTIWRRLWTALAALVVIVAIVALEFAIFRERLTEDLHLLTGASARQQAADHPTRPPLAPIPAPAPATAGAVDRVDLRALDSCTPGTVCAVRVLVRLQPRPEQPQPEQPQPGPPQAPVQAGVEAMPQSEAQAMSQPRPPSPAQPLAVTWTFRAIDRCTGAEHTLPGGSLSVAPGGLQAQAVTRVLLPAGHALALTAVTSAPANAASSPLLVPTDQSSC